ncbi:MAG: family 78 glycoside hydrolase catalytic domain [Acidobacteria bacterium]|nr:family 78 glycoside hydrolase catalytic domain [Acidobacteriota bacterium]
MKRWAVVAALGAGVLAAAPATVRPTGLRCEYRMNPEGIDEIQPRLTWTLTAVNSTARGLKQSAYRIVVASTPEGAAAGKGDLWDTGRVESRQSVLVAYKGKELASGMRAFWKVQVWDQAGTPSAWSNMARWSMGLLKETDWKGKWIGRDETAVYASPKSPFQLLRGVKWIWFDEGEPQVKAPAGERWFRAKLTLPSGRVVRHATFVLGADNSFELTLNGKRAGRGNSSTMPEVLDVAAALRTGENLVEVKARNARNDAAGLIGTLKVEFTEGEPLLFSTGAGWQASKEPGGEWMAAKELGAYGMAPWGEAGLAEEHALPARMLRKEFQARAGLRRAVLYVSGLGLSEVELNGIKVGDDVLSPNLTDYEKRVFYVAHEVTKVMQTGTNALGVWLGNGRYWPPRGKVPIGMRGYGYPKVRLQLELEYADGKRATVVSDGSWKLTTDGPVRVNNEFDGEEYDARREMAGWSKAGFNDAKWEAARIVEAPPGSTRAQMAEPLRVMETLAPKSVKEIRPGVWIYDMGQNMVGWARLMVQGAKGTEVRMRFAETLTPEGTLYLDNLRSARATDLYTLKGGGMEAWEPRFTYHGFRYVEVTGYPGKPGLESLSGRVVHDALERAGDWESSDETLNSIHRNIYWGIRGNYRSIPTDCPQRDERQGWLGDRSVVSRSESYLFDVAAFYTKFATDMRDAQRPTGSVPDVVPAYWVLYNDGIVWPSTLVLAPSMVYEQYGDLRLMERHYPAMKLWVEYMRGFLKDGIMPKNTYGDWCVPPEKPELIHSQDPARVTQGALLSTAYYHKMLELMSKYAKLTGHGEDAAGFDKLAAEVREAFVKRYYKAEEGRFDNGTQTSSVLGLAFGLAPEGDRKRVFDGLVRKIEVESANHVGVGLVGAQWLMRTLSDNGRADLAYRIATQKTYPGWGYMIEKGATTIWELWNGDTADPAMNSGNHVMQIGDLGVWMYEYLAGIRTDPEKPGFEHIIIKPYTVEGLTHVKATHRSPYGVIASEWRREAGAVTLRVTIPANTTATVHVPGKKGEVREVGSGRWEFRGE